MQYSEVTWDRGLYSNKKSSYTVTLALSNLHVHVPEMQLIENQTNIFFLHEYINNRKY